MNILIICLGTLSSGEAAIISSCFSSTRTGRVRLHAVVSELCKPYFDGICDSVAVLRKGDRLKNVVSFNSYVRMVGPDLFVCADLATMNHSASWSGVCIDQLKKYNVRIAGMDQYSSSDQSQVWDWLGSRSTVVEKNDSAHCDYIVRPVPLNKYEVDYSNIIHCPLFPGPREASGGNAVRQKVAGVKGSVYRIFLANSHWEYNDFSPRMVTSVVKLREWMPEIIYQYIRATGLRVEINHVGPRRWDRSMFADNITYRYFPSLTSSDYQELLRTSDALITTNVTSITMSLALSYGIPCLLLYNPKPINFRKLKPILAKLPSWYEGMAEDVGTMGAFRMFPWGWNNFLKNIVHDNCYMDLIVHAPVFEPSKCIHALTDILSDPDGVSKIAERSGLYFDEVSRIGCLSDKLAAVL